MAKLADRPNTNTEETRNATSRGAGEGSYYNVDRNGRTIKRTDRRTPVAYYCWRLRKGPRGAQETIAFAKASTTSELKIAVRKEIARIEKEGEKRKVVDTSSVEHVLNAWIAKVNALAKAGARRDQNTALAYGYQIPHINAAIGAKRASNVGVPEAQAVLDHYVAQGLGAWSQIKGLQVLCMALKLSVKALKEDGLVVPKEPEGRDRVLSEEEFADFLAELFRDRPVVRRDGSEGIERVRDRFAVAFILNTGLREHEALGTLELVARQGVRTGILEVATQLKRLVDPETRKPILDELGEQRWVLDETKGEQKRKVPLNAEAIDLLEGQMAMLREERAAAGEAYRENGLLFPTASGRPHRGRNVLRTAATMREAINERREAEGLEPYEHWTIHDLRRTYATYLADAEDNIHVVAEILGHTDIETTRKHYAHAQDRRLAAAGAKVGFARRAS